MENTKSEENTWKTKKQNKKTQKKKNNILYPLPTTMTFASAVDANIALSWEISVEEAFPCKTKRRDTTLEATRAWRHPDTSRCRIFLRSGSFFVAQDPVTLKSALPRCKSPLPSLWALASRCCEGVTRTFLRDWMWTGRCETADTSSIFSNSQVWVYLTFTTRPAEKSQRGRAEFSQVSAGTAGELKDTVKHEENASKG